jgi:hypothetical protein
MYQYDDATAVAVRPASTPPGTPGWPTDGNPLTNSPPSDLRSEHYSAMMDELINLVVAGGIPLSKTSFTGLVSSIAALASTMLNLVDTSTVANTMVATAVLPVSNPSPGTVPALASYKSGQVATITPALTNTGGTVTLNVNGLAALPVLRSDGSQPLAGDLPAGRPLRLYCTGTQFLLLAPTASQIAAAAATNYVVDSSGVANTMSATVAPAITLANGVTLRILPGVANTGPVTLTLNGTTYSVVRPDGTACAPNDIRGQKAFDAVAKTTRNGFLLQMLSWPTSGDGPKNPVAAAGYTYGAADGGNMTWRSNGGAAMVDALPGATAGALPAGWAGTIVNADAAGLLAIQVGAGSTLQGPNVYNGAIVIGPGEKVNFTCDGANYQCFSLAIRARLAANTTIFAGPAGSDAANVGITAATAFATGGHAYAWAQAALDLGGNQLTLSIAGNPTQPITCSGALVGQDSPVVITGGASGSTTLSTAAGGGIGAVSGAYITVQNMTITVSGAGSTCIGAGGSGSGTTATVFIGPGVVFGSAALAHIGVAQSGVVMLSSSYAISGGSGSHWFAQNGGMICNGNVGITVTLTNTIALTTAFATATNGGQINPAGVVAFSGSAATGARYSAATGWIYTNGSGANYLPGSAAGSGANYS